jgi:hypothetical protein
VELLHALADLAPPKRPCSRYALANQGNDIQAAMLISELASFPVVSPFGTPEGVAAILADATWPDRA